MKKWTRAAVVVIAAALLISVFSGTALAQESEDSDLTALIAWAEGLEEKDYTAGSWQEMNAALLKARYALQSEDRQTMNNAGLVLSRVLTEMVKMDYSALEDAVAQARSLLEQQEGCTELVSAILDAGALEGCGDQAAVDQAAERILTLNAQLEQTHRESARTQRIWIAGLGVSLAANLVLLVSLIVMAVRKRRQRDDVPLVDYDIENDMM